ncbi:MULTISPECIES: hypothetical protein [Amycolatopsis]|uniref:Secreted protein n=2 Tax=Amycolatopsis TaxID=1813 RepID=A0ABW5HVF1_9PSEU
MPGRHVWKPIRAAGSFFGARRCRSSGSGGVLRLAAIAASVLAASSALAAPGASAEPGSPGVPGNPKVLYQEGFQNGAGITELTDYASDAAAKYTADSYWLNNHRCNGFILAGNTPRPDLSQYCNNIASNFDHVRQKAYALGLLNNPQNPDSNRAVSSKSSGAADNNAPPGTGRNDRPGESDPVRHAGAVDPAGGQPVRHPFR